MKKITFFYIIAFLLIICTIYSFAVVLAPALSENIDNVRFVTVFFITIAFLIIAAILCIKAYLTIYKRKKTKLYYGVMVFLYLAWAISLFVPTEIYKSVPSVNWLFIGYNDVIQSYLSSGFGIHQVFILFTVVAISWPIPTIRKVTSYVA